MEKVKTNNKEKDVTKGKGGVVAQEEKLTIYDYEQKYVKRENVRGAKFLLKLIIVTIGALIFFCLFSITMRLYEVNEYVGYAMIGVSVILYIFFFIVPLVKILKINHFEVNVNVISAKAAKKHNRKVRHDIAGKIIDLTCKVEGVGWYDSMVVGRLAIALRANDEKKILAELSELYKGSVKKSANDLIFKSALKSGMYSALSQTNKLDALLVSFINLQLVKDLVFLYGFRPSDARLVKIFARVLQNSLVAYGLGGVRIGNSVVKSMGDVVKGIPVLGTAISALVDSSVQGLANGVLTAVIGYQTIKYLNTEYRLQEILDGVEITESDEEVRETCTEIARELKANRGKMPQAG